MKPCHPCQFCKNCKHATPAEAGKITCGVRIERDFVRHGTRDALQALPSFSCDEWRAK